MIDGLPESIVMLLGSRMPEWKQGMETRRARILTDLSDHRTLGTVLPLHQGQMLV